MPSEYMFHIRNANPGDMRTLLEVLNQTSDINSTAQVIELADEMGYAVQDRAHLDALPTARDLGLIESSLFLLTADGKALTQIDLENPSLFPDIVHSLMYGLWDDKRPADSCFSFSYRALCQELWRSSPSGSLNRKELAAKVESVANQAFARNDIALSAKSVGGAMDWLDALEPRVITDDGEQFRRRAFCPPESLLLAIDLIYRQSALDYGANLLLGEANRELLAQACLLELSSLDRVLEYAVAQFDFLDKGLGGGWGQFITLRRPPVLADFVRKARR